MDISNTVIISMVETVFVPVTNYSVYLTYSDATTSSNNTIQFGSAAYVSGDAGVTITMTGTTYFAIAAGKTVTHVTVKDATNDLIVEDVVDKTYASSGTYTVSGIKLTIKN